MADAREDIDAAIRVHAAAEHPGQLVIGWAVVVAVTNEDDNATDYDAYGPESQPTHHTVGLYHVGTQVLLTAGDDS